MVTLHGSVGTYMVFPSLGRPEEELWQWLQDLGQVRVLDLEQVWS